MNILAVIWQEKVSSGTWKNTFCAILLLLCTSINTVIGDLGTKDRNIKIVIVHLCFISCEATILFAVLHFRQVIQRPGHFFPFYEPSQPGRCFLKISSPPKMTPPFVSVLPRTPKHCKMASTNRCDALATALTFPPPHWCRRPRAWKVNVKRFDSNYLPQDFKIMKNVV